MQQPLLGKMILQGENARTSVIDEARVKICKILKASTYIVYIVRTLSKKGKIYQLIKGCK